MPAKKKEPFERWYAEYWAQSWYRNTYLVRHPREIAQELKGERDWNNLFDSGCNFTCIAMMVGVDPARLASELSRRRFFRAERGNRARTVTGAIASIVWDQNAPHAGRRHIRIERLWCSHLQRRVTVTVSYLGQDVTFDHADGLAIVRGARRRGEHVIAGASDHSHLVAGRIGREFYLWDPDDTDVPVEALMLGRLKLADLFAYYAGREPIEFWRYTVHRKIHRERDPPRVALGYL